MSDADALMTTLSAIPGWENLSAYEMTKRCCAELTRRGERLPSWMAIRARIGKGSANDINRGKADFRREHGDALRQRNGFVEGVPDTLAPHILGFWSAAIAHVRLAFEAQTRDWEARVEQAEARAAQTDADREAAVRRVDQAQAELAGWRAANATLQGQVATERAAREQAERMAEATRREGAAQRDELNAALARAQQELDRALQRLEGAEQHALMEIERVRADGRQALAAVLAQADREQNAQALELARLNHQLQEARREGAEARQRAAVLEQESAGLRERAQRAEAHADRLAQDHARLAAGLQQAAARLALVNGID